MSTSVSLTPAGAAPVLARLAVRRRRWGDVVFGVALRACVVLSVGFLVALVAFVLYKGWSRLDSRLWTEMPTARKSRIDTAGVQSAITGTLWVIGTTAAICLPVGIAAAIYLEEYADPRRWYNRLLELNIYNLAGVPSIVFGILGLGIIARTLGLGFSVLTAGLTLALLVLPVVIIAAREAIRAVPSSIRQASAALGASHWQTVSRQVLPSAVPGIATGSILAISRAIGEAAPLLMIGAASLVLFNPDGLDSVYTALPIQIFTLLKAPYAEFAELAAAAIVVLLTLNLALNALAIVIRQRATKKRW